MDVKELAKAMGLAPSTVYKWKMRKEDGGAYPSYEISRKLLELGASVEDLFGFDCSQKCPKQAEYVQAAQASAQVKEPPAPYGAESSDPIANSPTMKALIKRLEALEQRNYRAEKAG